MVAKVIKKTNARLTNGQWKISYSPVFLDSFERNQIVFNDLGTKLERFLTVKTQNPLSNRYGKHDRPMTGALTGFWHCHLRDDAVLIYNFAIMPYEAQIALAWASSFVLVVMILLANLLARWLGRFSST